MLATHRGASGTEARRLPARTPGPPPVRLPGAQPRSARPPRRAGGGLVERGGGPARVRGPPRSAALAPAQGTRPGGAGGPLGAAADPPAGRVDRLGGRVARTAAAPRR